MGSSLHSVAGSATATDGYPSFSQQPGVCFEDDPRLNSPKQKQLAEEVRRKNRDRIAAHDLRMKEALRRQELTDRVLGLLRNGRLSAEAKADVEQMLGQKFPCIFQIACCLREKHRVRI